MKRVGLVCLVVCMILMGCVQQGVKIDSSQNVELKEIRTVENREVMGIKSLEHLPEGYIPLSVHPEDADILYCMKYVDEGKKGNVIVGDYYRKVSVSEINTKEGTEKELISEMDFVTLAKWSPDKKYLGFIGGNQMWLYDQETGTVENVNKAINTPSILYFGWSPDSKKIYTEHENLPNDGIYDLISKEGLASYEIKDRKPYYKDEYKENVYIGTAETSDVYGNRTPITALLDQGGNIQKMVGEGRYRNHFEEQLVQVGKEHFGLIYFPDMENGKPLTDDYIYQVAFTPQGELIFTTRGDIGGVPTYKLHIYRKGKEICLADVSGPHFAIWPDGSYLTIGGYDNKKIDLNNVAKINGRTVGLAPLIDGWEKIDIAGILVVAADTYADLFYHEPSSEVEMAERLAQYYINTEEPVKQQAYDDLLQALKLKYKGMKENKKYHMTGEIYEITIDGNNASATAGFSLRDDGGSGWGFGCSYELVRKEGKWYITGLSTFPGSKERVKVEKVALDFIKNAGAGKKYNFSNEKDQEIYNNLKGEVLDLGQIQFWRMSMPHLASAVESANYAKVYLEGKEQVYTLILTKKSGSWKADVLSKEQVFVPFE
ncbi:hypothetical protein HNQ80_004584 [Anaerosolibacter carboniphilus]|uniref:WD40-like Beta Propeller Repeat n=1 Tax=Anaerosolibacter carboniphilus TaxID=1417629 RepID=A0A841L2L9_9FIRM|nr:WD40 repeat domain-containing protein [Anaerosolibacter carboniphilus]MBB6218420.1 hypothetical protein [Anaerosolibacter carboniphilus]